MHHPNGAWVTLPWGLPFQKLVAVPFPVQHHAYHALQSAAATGPPLITLHHPSAVAATGAPATASALPAALQTFVPAAAFSLQPPQPLTIRQVRYEFILLHRIPVKYVELVS